MRFELREETCDSLTEHGTIDISFEVRSVLAIEREQGGWQLIEHAVMPRVKDYDAFPDDRPERLGSRFDVRRWRIISAWRDGARVGGSIVAWNTPGVDMLEDRTDLALVWDLRIAPGSRGTGIGRSLWEASERWARSRACATLKVETQDTNVGASRFYERMGCALGGVNRHVYPEQPDEVQLLWYKNLA